MTENTARLIDKTKRPTEKDVFAWIGSSARKRWITIVSFLEENFPGVFPADDWIYGGKKHGWGLRFKKSKAFCTLVPERNRLRVAIVLGGKEREETEKIMSKLSRPVRAQYEEAKTYHDGKWLAVDVTDESALRDVFTLLKIKRRPKEIGK